MTELCETCGQELSKIRKLSIIRKSARKLKQGDCISLGKDLPFYRIIGWSFNILKDTVCLSLDGGGIRNINARQMVRYKVA